MIDKTDAGLGATFKEAMRIRDAMKVDGATVLELDAAMERTLRAAWPQTRVWHFICEACSDTGWKFGICGPHTHCGRPCRLPNQRGDDFTGQGRCQPGHTYVRPCVCEKGDNRRRNLTGTKAPEDFTQAATTTRRTPSRFGR